MSENYCVKCERLTNWELACPHHNAVNETLLDRKLAVALADMQAERDAEAAKARVAVAGMTAARSDCDVLRRAMDAACRWIGAHCGCPVPHKDAGTCPDNKPTCTACWREHFTAQAQRQATP